jgi:uncharacterized membrane protein YbhN (UPF0104 family)
MLKESHLKLLSQLLKGLFIVTVAVFSYNITKKTGLFTEGVPRNIQLAFLYTSLITILVLMLNGLRHALLIAKPMAPWSLAFKSLILSSSLNLVIPARLAEAIKVIYLRRHITLSLSNGLVAIALERLLDLVVFILLLVCVAVYGMLNINYQGMASKFTLYLSVASILGLGAYCLVAKNRKLKLFAREVWNEFCEIFFSKRFFGAIILTVIVWGLQLLSCITFLQIQTVAPVTVFTSLVVFVAICIAAALPGPPAGVGIFQAGVALVLVPTGVSIENAIFLGIMLQLSYWWFPVLYSIIIMVREDLGIKKLMQDCIAYFQEARR